MLRDVFIILFVMGSLPFALTRPFFGLVMFSWLAYMRPQDLCWGPARGQRFSLFMALAMYAGYIFYENRRPFTRWVAQQKYIIGLGVWILLGLVIFGARRPNFQYGKLIDLYKVMLVAMFTIGLTDSKQRLDVLCWTIGLSLGFFGFKGGLFGVFTGGRILQGPGGMLKDNNDLCLALNMVLPIVFYMGQMSPSKRVKRLSLVGVMLIAVAVVITTSRGGILTLAGVAFLLVLKSNKKLIGFSAGAFALFIFLLFLPQDVKDRLETVKNPTEEGSAAGRLFAWSVAWEMSQQNPLFGVGFENFIMEFANYAPRFQSRSSKGVESIRVTHNSYLQILSETGWPALLFFLGMLGCTFLQMHNTRRRNRRARGPPWVTMYTHMVDVSLAAFCSGAMFLNRSHFDLLYHMVAIGAVVNLLGRRVLAGEKVDLDEEVEEVPRLTYAPKRPTLAGRS